MTAATATAGHPRLHGGLALRSYQQQLLLLLLLLLCCGVSVYVVTVLGLISGCHCQSHCSNRSRWSSTVSGGGCETQSQRERERAPF